MLKPTINKTIASAKSNLVSVAKSLAIAWVVLSLADTIITYVCLQDIANIEGNPLARALLSHNEALFYGAKLIVTIVIGAGFWWLATKTTHLKAMIAAQTVLVVLFIGVLSNNMLHL